MIHHDDNDTMMERDLAHLAKLYRATISEEDQPSPEIDAAILAAAKEAAPVSTDAARLLQKQPELVDDFRDKPAANTTFFRRIPFAAAAALAIGFIGALFWNHFEHKPSIQTNVAEQTMNGMIALAPPEDFTVAKEQAPRKNNSEFEAAAKAVQDPLPSPVTDRVVGVPPPPSAAAAAAPKPNMAVGSRAASSTIALSESQQAMASDKTKTLASIADSAGSMMATFSTAAIALLLLLGIPITGISLRYMLRREEKRKKSILPAIGLITGIILIVLGAIAFWGLVQ